MARAITSINSIRSRSTDNVVNGNIALGVSFGSGNENTYRNQTFVNGQTRDSWNSLMKGCGISWARVDVKWLEVQTTQGGAFSWTLPDKCITPLLAAGINVLIVLGNPPSWAKPVDSHLSDWTSYAAATVGHYAPLGVHAYEIWNEPNGLGDGWGCWGIDKVGGCVRLHHAAYSTIHTADSQATVISAAPTSTNSPTISGTALTGASWSSQAAGASTLTITCSSALAADYGAPNTFHTGGPIPGTYLYHSVLGSYLPVVAATDGSWTVTPPGNFGTFPAITGATNQTVRKLTTLMAPLEYLTQFYAYAVATYPGETLFDALGHHPYSTPNLPLNYGLQFEGWTIMPSIRELMVANGDGNKSIWVTEVGWNTGMQKATIPAGDGTNTITITVSESNANDVGYTIICTSSSSSAVDDGTFPSGTTVTAVNDTSYTLTAPGSSTFTNSASSNHEILIYDDANNVSPVAFGCTEVQQSSSLVQSLQSFSIGASGTVDSGVYPFIGVCFIFCLQDSTDGPFGITRVDGTPKAAYNAIATAMAAGG